MKRQRGNVIVFVLLSIIFLLTVAGVAVDVGALFVARSELHRATDAGALAGAGKLGFDDTVFQTARDYSVNFAANNPTHFGPVALSRNDVNAANGDVVLGIWAGGGFTPSLDGSQVNAVLCRTRRSIPISFGQLAGIPSVTIGAESVAVSNPPNTAPGCVFPIGVTTCQFSSGSAWTSLGCGSAVTFATSSGKVPGTQAGTNTAAWVDLTGANPTAPTLKQAIEQAVNGSCTANPLAGQTIGANNGMIQTVVDTFQGYFVQKYDEPNEYVLHDADGHETYRGRGWEVYLPLIQTACPPKDINQQYTIQTFAKFVFTQVINGGECVRNNPADQNSYPLCPPPNGPGIKDPSLRAIFGYFDCATLNTTPTTIPTPRAALATRLRLVK